MPLTTGVQNQPPKRGFSEGLPVTHYGPENAALHEVSPDDERSTNHLPARYLRTNAILFVNGEIEVHDPWE